MSATAESAQAIAQRMDQQRSQLHSQFVRPPQPVAPIDVAASDSVMTSTAMQPYQPRSLLMQLLVANPHLIQRVLLLAVTAALGARYSSWAMRLFGLFMAVRRRR